MTVQFNNSYRALRKLIESGIDASGVVSPEIDVIDLCGYRGVTDDSADTVLMHAADSIIENWFYHDGLFDENEPDRVIELVTEHQHISGLDRISDETWKLVEAIVSGMVSAFNEQCRELAA